MKSWWLKTPDNFVFLDTEGQHILREITLVDYQGNLIYQAFVKDHYNNTSIRVSLKTLTKIIQEIKLIFTEQINSKIIVCHNAEHDRKILVNSFLQEKLNFPPLPFICTIKLAQQCYPQYPSYTLGYLAKQLRLKFQQQLFREKQAHTAYYDAQFTRQLFFHLTNVMSAKSNLGKELSHYPNPFTSSRVDNPFQNHPDYQLIYQPEFDRLKNILTEVKADANNQSKGVVILGEAGAGKTHLIMRIAQQLLARNRLLFIRQPNNPQRILSHTYARILESFFQPVPSKNRTQIELLIAHSFTQILSSIDKVINSQQGKKLISQLQNDSLSLFNRLGNEDTDRHTRNWNIIERNILAWWTDKYSEGGYSSIILQGLIKFCRYNRADYKAIIRRWLAGNELESEELNKIGLKNWQGNLSKEEFSLEAIKVFANLSTLDEPLIIVFDQLEGLGLPQNKNILSSFGLAIKEIITHIPNSLIILNLFPHRWQQFQQSFDESITERLAQNLLNLQLPKPENLKQILNLKAQAINLKLEQIFTTDELSDILNQSSIRKVVNRASDYFNYKAYNIPLPEDNLDKNSVNLAERITLLENTLQQIARLVSPFLSINNQEIDLEEIINQPEENQIHNEKSQLQTDFKKQNINLNHGEIDNYENPVKQKLFTYFDNQKKLMLKDYEKPQVITDEDDIGKLTTIAETFKIYYPKIEINQLRLGKRKLPEHLSISNHQLNLVIAFLHLGGSSFTSRIKNFNQLVVTNTQFNFTLFRDSREPKITGKVGKLEIAKLNNTKNGKFIILERENRINFELIYNFIIDIQEQNLELNLNDCLQFLPDYFTDYWLTSLLKS